MSLDSVSRIYPETFFNVSHPDVPLVAIQFRTDVKKNLNDATAWESATYNPNNFFDNISIEDAGGMQRVELTLQDKNFATIENLIINSMIATRQGNKLAENEVMTEGEWSMTFDNTSMANIRIRFGYAEAGPTTNTVVDTTSFEDKDWTERISSGNTVIKSPWLYLQMIGSKFNVTETGLTVTLSAFTIVDNFLTRAKLLRKYAILRGTPDNIIADLNKMVGEVTGDKLVIGYDSGEAPLKPTTAENDGIIEISLGSAVNVNQRGWKSMASILSELASKVPPKIFKKDDTELTDPNSDEGLKEASKIVPYSYHVLQKDDGTVNIKFYYPNPTGLKQSKIRTYLWKEFGNSIVRNVNIESSMDFANLNRQILATDLSTGEMEVYGSVANKATSAEEIDSASTNSLTGISRVTDAITNPDFTYGFVSDAYSSDSGIANDNTIGGRIARTVVSYLNESIFSGTIEIPGDPYYLFDTYLRPYEHAIRLIINRPAYVDKDGSYKANSTSYLSGHYVIKKITHRINGSGFNTTLEVTRWPIEKTTATLSTPSTSGPGF